MKEKSISLNKIKSAKNIKNLAPFKIKVAKKKGSAVDRLLSCMKNNDLETFQIILIEILTKTNKKALAEKAGIERRTLYRLLDLRCDFNPELATIAALMKALV